MRGQSPVNQYEASRAALAAWLIMVVLSGCAAPSTAPPPTEIPAPTVVDASADEPAGRSTPTVAEVATDEPAVTPTPPPTPIPPTEIPATRPLPTATTPPTETPAASARYQLTFEATWSPATHPTDFPANPHFSGLIGAAHDPSVRLWAEGETATPGMKNMAETGGKSPLDGEIDSLIGEGSACETISGGGISPSPGAVTVTFTVNLDCPVVSVVSMIAPSPDWFVGVSGMSLLEDGQWIGERVVALHPYDAGTDRGSSYASADEPEGSAGAIRTIETEPLLVDGDVPLLGTFAFSRLDD